MIHSKIAKVLEKNIKDEDLLNNTRGKFRPIESEIDSMLNRADADIDNVLDRAKDLIERVLGGVWVSTNWKKIGHDIKDEIENSQR